MEVLAAAGVDRDDVPRPPPVGGDPTFAYLGTTGIKRFVDATLPEGSGRLVYRIQAVRSTKAGAPAEFNVNFGMTAGGAVAGMVPKIAA